MTTSITTEGGPTDVQDKLRALVRLAEIDALARGIDDQLQGIPRELEERMMSVRALEALVGGQTKQAADAERLLAQHEEELKQRNDMLAKSKAKGAKARNMRESEAAERELEAIRRSIRDAETEKERLGGVIAQTRDVLSGPMQELDVQKTALAEAELASGARLTELRAERDKIVVGRERFAHELPKHLMRRYERLRVKLHPMIAEILDSTCKGCNRTVPAQLANEIKKANDFHQCPHCQRFLYVREMID